LSDPVKQILRFILFTLVQALILSHIPPIHRFITPYLYYLFLLWLPFSTSRTALLIWGFFTGFVLDLFMQTPGLHASACLLVAYLRPMLVNLLMPGDAKDLASGSPNIRSMGFSAYAVFVLVLTLFHHAWLVLLEWMSFGSLLFFVGKVTSSAAISLMLVLVAELLFRPVRRSNARR